jgi:hypothetical protein
MALHRKELKYLKNEMTWREFADGAGAKVILRPRTRIIQEDSDQNDEEIAAEYRTDHGGRRR